MKVIENPNETITVTETIITTTAPAEKKVEETAVVEEKKTVTSQPSVESSAAVDVEKEIVVQETTKVESKKVEVQEVEQEEEDEEEEEEEEEEEVEAQVAVVESQTAKESKVVTTDSASVESSEQTQQALNESISALKISEKPISAEVPQTPQTVPAPAVEEERRASIPTPAPVAPLTASGLQIQQENLKNQLKEIVSDIDRGLAQTEINKSAYLPAYTASTPLQLPVSAPISTIQPTQLYNSTSNSQSSSTVTTQFIKKTTTNQILSPAAYQYQVCYEYFILPFFSAAQFRNNGESAKHRRYESRWHVIKNLNDFLGKSCAGCADILAAMTRSRCKQGECGAQYLSKLEIEL